MWVWVGRKKSLKAGGCVDRRWIEQDLRFMSGKGGKKLKSGRSVSEQTGRLFPTSWGRGTSASTRHGVTAIGCRLGQATLQGQNYREQAWHWEGAGYPVLPPGHPGVSSHCASPQAHQRPGPSQLGHHSQGRGEDPASRGHGWGRDGSVNLLQRPTHPRDGRPVHWRAP